MQKAEHILSLLGKKSAQHPDFVFRRFYRYLYHPDFYQTLSKGHLSKEDSVEIFSLIEALRYERYRPGNEAKDRYLLHAMNQLLTAIYRPMTMTCVKMSPTEALQAISSISSPEGWIIEMPSEQFFQQLSPAIFDRIVRKKISDERWFRLASMLLRAQNWPAIWLDILLQSFDQWIIRYAQVRYIRYRTAIFLLIQGTRRQADVMHQRINQWMIEYFGVEDFAKQSKVRFFARHRLLFLEYDVQVDSDQRIRLWVPTYAVNQSLRPFRKQGKSIAVTSRIYLPIERTIQIYRAEREAFRQRYTLAKNLHQRLRFFSYYHFLSLLKTIARKKNLSVKQVRHQYQHLLADYWP